MIGQFCGPYFTVRPAKLQLVSFPTIPINLTDIINILLRGGPLEIMGAGVIIFHSTNIFFVQFVCMHFDFDVEALHDFFFDRTSFNIKGMQSFPQFNCSTAQGGILFGVSIFAKFEYRDYRERNELLRVSHLMTRGTFFNLSRKLGFVVLVDTILYS